MRKTKEQSNAEFRIGAGTILTPGLLVAALLMTLAVYSPSARAQANVQGTWTTLTQQMQINPVHTALMSNGKILIVSGSGNYPAQTTFQVGVWDPSNNTMTVGTQSWDQFCNGIAVFPDGRPFIAGGNLQYDPFFGWQRTTVYDPATGQYTDMEDMAHGRWYPTNTILGDGRLMTISGLNENGGTNATLEIYTVGQGWGAPVNLPFTPPLYPRMHLLPDGTVFYSGSTTQSRTFDPSNNTWSGVIATTNYSGTRTYGSSVLLPLTPANTYKPKVMIFGGGNPATATTEIIDLSAATPAWVNGPNMSQPRIEMNATLLPTGKILTVGGSLNDEDTSTASLQADLYDVASNTMGSAGSNGFARLYHSVALLLPDATVWVAGGNPTRGSFEPHVEIYTPPYLFQANGTPAVRPTITTTSTNVVGYANNFTVTTPDAANITSVVLMKNGAATHAFDMEQRMVGLSFGAGGGSLTVTAPPNSNIAPPGYYMLFLINNAGVPSVAKFLQLSKTPNDPAPTGAITAPATDVTINPGQSVTFTGTGTAGAGTITGYSWSIRGSTTPTSAAQNPGAVTFANPGTYKAILTVTDTAGNTDPSPPTRTITVSADPAPTLTTAAPNSALQGTTNLNVVLTGTNFLTGPNCDFGAGIEVNTCTFNSATQITANIDVLSNATNGPRDVTVTNSDSQSATLAGGFTVTAGMALPAPTLTSVSPNAQFQGATGVALVLTGTNFRASPTCNFNADFGGVNNTCTFVSATEIDATVSVDGNAQLGGHNVVVTNADGQSATLINGFTVTENLGNTVHLGSGFTTGALVLNGNAQLNGSNLEITDGNLNEDSSAWYATPVNVGSFVTDFTFQITPGTTADGFAFVLQNNNTAALGTFGGGLGYGPIFLTDPPGIPNSIAVKFDLYSNNGEGVNSTGLYVDGVSPSTPAIDMTTVPAGIDLHSGDIFAVHMTYDGTSLILTITDTQTNAVFTHTFPIDIPGTVGGPTAYAGFTGGTGGLAAVQNIMTWTLGPTSPGVGFTPTGPVNFPDTATNATSAATTITVKNNGSAALHVTGVSFGGANPGDFAASTDTCTGQTVAINATCTVGVTFSPSGTGARAANLQIADDAAGSPQTVALAGNGLAPGTPVATITPASPIMFPSTTQGVASSPVTVTVTNSGNANLVLSSESITGTNMADFVITANTCLATTLSPNSTCTLGITFTPVGTGARTATVQVADNAAGTPQTATLTGTGVAAAPVVTTTPTGAVNFPNTVQNVTSAAMPLVISNTGNAVLNISAITITGTNAGDFAIASNTCGATLAASANCTVSLTFKPTAVGVRAASLQIADNGSGSPQLVSLTGTGTAVAAPAVTVAPTALTLSATQGTTSGPMSVTVTNSGSATLHVTGVAFSGANTADFVNPTGSCAAAIAPNGMCTIAVSFAPVTPMSTTSRVETITITDDAANSPQTVSVTGTVSASAFTVTSAASALTATVTAGQTANYNLQITPGAGYAGSVNWACTGAPATTACTVTPNPVPLTAGTAATFAVNVTTTARSVLAPPANRQPLPPTSPIALLSRLLAGMALLALLLELKRRGGLTTRQIAYCGGALLLVAALYGAAGCASGPSSGGGGGGTSGTQAGTYTLTLTPTANGNSGKPLTLTPITLTLNVN